MSTETQTEEQVMLPKKWGERLSALEANGPGELVFSQAQGLDAVRGCYSAIYKIYDEPGNTMVFTIRSVGEEKYVFRTS